MTKDTIFYPEKEANAISLGTLLIANNLNLTEVNGKGGIFRINFFYECYLKRITCDPQLTFDRLSKDDQLPVYMEDTYYYKIGNEEYRDFITYIGFRIIFSVKGKGNTVSIPAIIL